MEQRPIRADPRFRPVEPDEGWSPSLEVVAVADRWREILALSAALAILAAGYVLLRQPLYESKVQLEIENGALELLRDEPVVTPAPIPPNLLETQVRVLGSRGLASEVVDRLDLAADPEFTGAGPVRPLAHGANGADPAAHARAVATFAQRLAAKSLGLSDVVEVGFRSSDPDNAARIANEVARAYLERLDRSAAARGRGASAWVEERLQTIGVRASVLSAATPPATATGIRGALLVPGAALAGLVLGAMLAIALKLGDWRARTPADLERLLGAEFLGALPPGPTASAPGAIAGCRALAQVEAALIEWRPSHGITLGLVTSAGGEGGATVATALAMQLARHGNATMLIDGNAADPVATGRIGPSDAVGLADLLRGTADDEVPVAHDPERGFDFLPVGRMGEEAEPTLLRLPAFDARLQRLRQSYDFVLVDLPPLGSPELRAVGSVDAFLLVLKPPPHPRAALRDALARSGRARERLLGFVLDPTPRAGWRDGEP